jgi:hypothetical protein
MFVNKAQQVAHVKVIKVDPGNFPRAAHGVVFGNGSAQSLSITNRCRAPQCKDTVR